MNLPKATHPLGNAPERLTAITDWVTVNAVNNVYTIDFANMSRKNVIIPVSDAAAKSFILSNIPVVCELNMILNYANAAAITFFAGTTAATWLNGTPLFTAGLTYEVSMITFDGGTTWKEGVCAGGWA